MEKILEKLFDIKRIPTKLIFVIWISSGLILFMPPTYLSRLNISAFLLEYGKYIGICFIVASAFLLVTFFSSISKMVSKRKFKRDIEAKILKNIKNLDYHEKALLREFFINGKNTIQLPIDNATVTGLVNKHIIYQASNTGFTYAHGAYFPYSITGFADENLTEQMLDIPNNINQEVKTQILNQRPQWAVDRENFENKFFKRW